MKKQTGGIIAAILTMSAVQMGTNAISPILAQIQRDFSAASPSMVQFLMTFPSLFVVVVSLLSARLAARFPKKYLAALGCALFSLSGVLSWLNHGSLTLLFAFGAIMGIGIGLVVPLAPSLVADFFTGNEQKTVMGWQSGSASVGAMIMTFLGGFLAEIHWSYNYLVYLVAIPGLVLSLVMLPPRAPNQEAGKAATGSVGQLFKGPVVTGCLFAALVTMLFNLLPTNLSMYLNQTGLGTPAQAGLGTSLLLLGGALGGILFGKLAARFQRRVAALGFFMLAAGLLCMILAPNIWMIYLGCLLGGSCISLVMPQLMMEGITAAGSLGGMASALIMSASNLGGFFTPMLTMVAGAVADGEQVLPRWILGIALTGLLGINRWLVRRK